MKEELTALDWMGAIVAAVGIAWAAILLPLVFTPRFTLMFRDFGGRLPAPTLVMMLQWPPMLASMVPASLLGAGVAGGRPLRVRRGLVVAAFVAAGVLVGGELWALYLPIFELAGKIR